MFRTMPGSAFGLQFIFVPVGDVSPMLYSPSIPSTGRIVIINCAVMRMNEKL